VSVTALTNCPKAIDRPESYKPPVAAPVGDLMTGEERPVVKRIERESQRLLRQ
jgi:hypothetical protein